MSALANTAIIDALQRPIDNGKSNATYVACDSDITDIIEKTLLAMPDTKVVRFAYECEDEYRGHQELRDTIRSALPCDFLIIDWKCCQDEYCHAKNECMNKIPAFLDFMDAPVRIIVTGEDLYSEDQFGTNLRIIRYDGAVCEASYDLSFEHYDRRIEGIQELRNVYKAAQPETPATIVSEPVVNPSAAVNPDMLKLVQSMMALMTPEQREALNA